MRVQELPCAPALGKPDADADGDDSVNDDDALFTISQVASAAGVPANTIRSWFQRGHLVLHQLDKAADRNGLPRKFSMRSALAIAAAADLVKLGVAPDSAARAANAWAHIGDQDRLPAGLYERDFTVLCGYASGDYLVQRIGSDVPAFNLFLGRHGREDGVSAILLNFVDRRVRIALEGLAR
jgi:hypothetical protein